MLPAAPGNPHIDGIVPQVCPKHCHLRLLLPTNNSHDNNLQLFASRKRDFDVASSLTASSSDCRKDRRIEKALRQQKRMLDSIFADLHPPDVSPPKCSRSHGAQTHPHGGRPPDT